MEVDLQSGPGVQEEFRDDNVSQQIARRIVGSGNVGLLSTSTGRTGATRATFR
jgi:hypothetical protein